MGLREDVEREWLEREQRIVRYCAGRLSAVDEAAFEAELLEDTELASDVQLAMVLRDALQQPEQVPKAGKTAAKLLRSPWLALAAGILIGIVGISVLKGPDANPEVFGDVEYLTLGVVRSAEPQVLPRTQRLGERSLLIVEVPAEPSIDQVEVTPPNGRPLLLSGTRDQGYLRIALPPPVASGDYSIVSGPVRYSFTVESRPD